MAKTLRNVPALQLTPTDLFIYFIKVYTDSINQYDTFTKDINTINSFAANGDCSRLHIHWRL